MSAAAGDDDLDDFGSFTAAERLSDPYADVYGLPADQPAAGLAPAATAMATSAAAATSGSPSLLAFSPVHGPALALNVSPRSLADPFADILAASAGVSTAAPAAAATPSAANAPSLLSFSPLMSATTTATAPAMNLLSSSGGNSAAAAPSMSGLLLPPPRSSAASSAAPPPVVSDLLSFSPLAADASAAAPFADVFGSISAPGSSVLGASGGDPFSVALDAPGSARAADERATNSFSVAAPVSEFDLGLLSDALPHVPASAPASLHGSFQHAASSFAAPDEATDDDWTDFVAADDASDGKAAEEAVGDGQGPSAVVWGTTSATLDPFGALGSSSTLIAPPAQQEPALDASSSSLGAFELPSPQSLGIEGASSASAELKSDIYFFSQDSTEATSAKNTTAEAQASDRDVSSSGSEDRETALAEAGSREGGVELDPVDFDGGGATSSGVSEEEADLWGPLSPPSSSPSPADVEEKAPAVSTESNTPVSLGLADVSALDPFSFTGASASNDDAPASNDSSGDYYNLLAGTTTASIAPIEFTTVTTGEDDEFGDFSAGHDAVGFPNSSGEEAAADAFDDFPQASSTPSILIDDVIDVSAQQSVETVFDGGMDQVQVVVDSFEESKSELANSFPGTVVGSVDPFSAIDHSNDDSVGSDDSGNADDSSPVADLKPEDGADAFGDFAHVPSSPGREDGNSDVDGTIRSFAQNAVGSEDVPIATSRDDSDDFGDFTHSSGASAVDDAQITSGVDEFGDFSHTSAFLSSANTNSGEDDDDGFGDFADSSNFASSTTASADAKDDGFGDFAQSSALSADAGDDFGDFADSSAFDDGGDDDFGGFSASSAPPPSAEADDDAFGDFSSPPTSVGASQGETVAVGSFADDQDFAAFFTGAFADVSVSVTIDASAGNVDEKFTSSYMVDSVATSMTAGLVASIVNDAVESYIADVTSDAKTGGEDPSRGNKLQDGTYIKYVLTEKIQEASQQNGIFPHGSEQHQSYLSIAAEGDPSKMREALKSLQDELFHKSVNDAMMRIARQAALSAKAKIAEQAAQQQANSKGSLLATTRQLLLSRNGGGSSSGSNASGSHDRTAGAAVGGGSLGVLTPTGASVHKHSRFSFGHEDASSTSGGEAKSDEPKRRHSGSSEADVSHGSSASTGASRTSSFGGTSSSGVASGTGSASGNGGLMKKFQDRFSSFSSSRHHNKTRVVSLRRMGQSGEDVRAMEINMDSISGGLDEVKWKCARFLYDVEEVSHVAPAQIRILSYPGNQVLSSKSDRSALVKFLKPGAVWTIDIGASNNDMLNEW